MLFEPRACVVYWHLCLYSGTCGFPCGFNVGSKGLIEADVMRTSCYCSIFAIVFVSGHVWFPMWRQCSFPGNSATDASALSGNVSCSTISASALVPFSPNVADAAWRPWSTVGFLRVVVLLNRSGGFGVHWDQYGAPGVSRQSLFR